MNGAPAVSVGIQKQSGANTVAVAAAVRREMERINSERDDVHLAVVSDQSEFIRQSIDSVRSSALWGSLLAVFVLYFFLRSRSSSTRDHRAVDPDLGDRHLRAAVLRRHDAQPDDLRRARPRRRSDRRQRHRRAREHRAQARGGRAAGRGGGAGRRPRGRRRDRRLDPDHLRHLPAGGLRAHHQRRALPGAGAGRGLRPCLLAAGGADPGADARVAFSHRADRRAARALAVLRALPPARDRVHRRARRRDPPPRAGLRGHRRAARSSPCCCGR